jgi:hypothetical protein
LQPTLFVYCGGIQVVDEHHAVPDEHAVFDDDTFANEGMTRYLALAADGRTLLNLHERPDLCASTNDTAV